MSTAKYLHRIVIRAFHWRDSSSNIEPTYQTRWALRASRLKAGCSFLRQVTIANTQVGDDNVSIQDLMKKAMGIDLGIHNVTSSPLSLSQSQDLGVDQNKDNPRPRRWSLLGYRAQSEIIDLVLSILHLKARTKASKRAINSQQYWENTTLGQSLKQMPVTLGVINFLATICPSLNPEWDR